MMHEQTDDFFVEVLWQRGGRVVAWPSEHFRDYGDICIAGQLRELETNSGETCKFDWLLGRYRSDGLPPPAMFGHYAYCLFDAHQRRVLAANDTFGSCPLYYAQSGGSLYISTRIAWIVERVGGSFNWSRVADFVLGASDHDSETYFKGIQRVSPGHILVATPETVRVTPSAGVCKGRRHGEGVHAIATRIPLMLARRLETLRSVHGTPIAMGLSSGIDSTLLYRSTAGELIPICLDFAKFGSCNERGEIERFLHAHGQGATQAWLAPPSTTPFSPTCGSLYAGPQPVAQSIVLEQLAREAIRVGARVLVTGLDGDGIFFSSPTLAFGQMVSERRTFAALREVRRSPVLARHFLRRRFSLAMRRHLPLNLRPLSERFLREHSIGERLAARPQAYSQDQYRWTMNNVGQSGRFEYQHELGQRIGVKIRDGYFGIEAHELADYSHCSAHYFKGKNRVLQRRAAAALCGPEVAWKRGKVYYDEYVLYLLKEPGLGELKRLLFEGEIAGEIFDVRWLAKCLERFLLSKSLDRFAARVLWCSASLVYWLNQLSEPSTKAEALWKTRPNKIERVESARSTRPPRSNCSGHCVN